MRHAQCQDARYAYCTNGAPSEGTLPTTALAPYGSAIHRQRRRNDDHGKNFKEWSS
jgi:hypothetical protein